MGVAEALAGEMSDNEEVKQAKVEPFDDYEGQNEEDVTNSKSMGVTEGDERNGNEDDVIGNEEDAIGNEEDAIGNEDVHDDETKVEEETETGKDGTEADVKDETEYTQDEEIAENNDIKNDFVEMQYEERKEDTEETDEADDVDEIKQSWNEVVKMFENNDSGFVDTFQLGKILRYCGEFTTRFTRMYTGQVLTTFSENTHTQLELQ